MYFRKQASKRNRGRKERVYEGEREERNREKGRKEGGLIPACQGSPSGPSGKEPDCQCRRHKRHGFDPWVGKIPWKRAWQPTPVFFLENPTDRGAWQATVQRDAQSWPRLK